MSLRNDLAGDERGRRKAAFALIVCVQVVAATFFAADAFGDMRAKASDLHTVIETVIAAGLLLGSAFGISELRRSHDLLRSHEVALATAAGALADVIADHFSDWKFTPAEREVAMLSLKGFDLPDIARLRGVAQGTIRAQLASVYAKSGTSGRAQFTSFFVEDLLAGGIGDARTGGGNS